MIQRGKIKIGNGFYFMTGRTFLETKDLFQCYFQLNSEDGKLDKRHGAVCYHSLDSILLDKLSHLMFG